MEKMRIFVQPLGFNFSTQKALGCRLGSFFI